jgi:hypothetical protein
MGTRAQMGYIGFLKLLLSTGPSIVVRATSCDIKTSQEISYPDVVDARADQTIYQLGPKVTGGSVAFPLIHDVISSSNTCPTTGNAINTALQADSLIRELWILAAARDSYGKLTDFTSNVRYSDSLGYSYPLCLVNSLTLTVAQSNAIECSMDVWGGASALNNGVDRTLLGTGDFGIPPNDVNYLAPARVATWNDFVVYLYNIGTNPIQGRELREFTVTINNNLERFYTLNGSLATYDIAAKKREISGTIKILGNNIDMTNYTSSNENRYTSNAQIGFGLKLGSNNPYWGTGLNGCVFEIEEVSLSTGLFETSTKYRALGYCGLASDTPNGITYDATFEGQAGALPTTNPGTAYDSSVFGPKTLTIPTYGSTS